VTYREAHEPSGPVEWREVEQILRSRGAQPQPVWKLAYIGSVGSQTLVGIPVLKRLRENSELRDISRVWPFEVLTPDTPSGTPMVVHAEIWPSIVDFAHEDGTCNDERQWRDLDRQDRLVECFAAAASETARREEGWVLGVFAAGANQTFRRPQPPVKPAARANTQPPAPAGRLSSLVGRLPCLCGCGNYPRGSRSRFMPGHDQRINPQTGRRFNDHH
jgi:hypothetical protein